MDEEKALYEALGRNIRQMRELATPRLSQAKLAEKVAVSRVSMVNIEAGRQHAPMHLLWRIAKALGTDLGRLIPKQSELTSQEDSAHLDQAFIEVIEGFSEGDDAMKQNLLRVVAQLAAPLDSKDTSKSSS